jgi:hypothetical protein
MLQHEVHHAYIVVKCAKCRVTYTFDDVYVEMTPVYDPDGDAFVQYDVTFRYEDGTEAYIDNMLCVPRRCSVFGRTETVLFAFPRLTPSKGSKWFSHPDSTGTHMAMRKRRMAEI